MLVSQELKMRRSCGQIRTAPADRSAFTLVEVITAMTIIALVFIVLHFGIAQSFAVVRTCRESLRASQILEEKMETVRLYKWEDINTTGFVRPDISDYYYPDPAGGAGSGAHYTGTLTVSDAGIIEGYRDDMKLFVAKLDWTTSGIKHHREMQTFVSRYGLQNYVYPSTTPPPI
jgi:prepilin-type N-terminal cleavage/methylation domain-containing protein